ncbi:Signal recognition particle SEC65 subunit [Neolecta irregularis DAH-3]|uniref:Signal recognition particle SEC65 subunit n=1 Tax=Neolecta irregularis (strain DAH-3) TaxID=1198029 RepID=A0A1U7LQ41_NEOID|nr:Signal recognition particle SEC65 subunit [Neolecta irregularis DAH-3]|eukprot:OLL24749.1 Signal recognition particle SEC65 subunit [Neolecta irregularis DAH-3]
MSRRPQLEEVNDSDDEISEVDISSLPAAGSVVPMNLQNISAPLAQSNSEDTIAGRHQMEDDSAFKSWICIYPIFFDIAKSYGEGRRVSADNAVECPLAYTLAGGARFLQIPHVFEPIKIHPGDWANPGRIRVLLKGRDGLPTHPTLHTKKALYTALSHFLKKNPTTRETPLKFPIRGLPSEKILPPPACPKGWKLNAIVPLHSNAVTGGGISENFMQDMMEKDPEMMKNIRATARRG